MAVPTLSAAYKFVKIPNRPAVRFCVEPELGKTLPTGTTNRVVNEKSAICIFVYC
jgi:hypothetical protein